MSNLSREHLKTEFGISSMKEVQASLTKNVERFEKSIPKPIKAKRVYFKDLEGRYQSFCKERYHIKLNKMPSFMGNLFAQGVADEWRNHINV